MLTEKEREFINWWEANRVREKKWIVQLLVGIPVGLIFSVPILLLLFSGNIWYKRAAAVANTQTSPVVLVIAILLITVFVALFYKKHQWEMKDQIYRELKNKEKEIQVPETE